MIKWVNRVCHDYPFKLSELDGFQAFQAIIFVITDSMKEIVYGRNF
jgi:hypothetical protein